jgi:hypothetical protein
MDQAPARRGHHQLKVALLAEPALDEDRVGRYSGERLKDGDNAAVIRLGPVRLLGVAVDRLPRAVADVPDLRIAVDDDPRADVGVGTGFSKLVREDLGYGVTTSERAVVSDPGQ